MSSHNWSTSDIPDLSGKTIIITGANSGLGLEATKAFAVKNAKVIMACRTVSKGELAKAQIIETYPAADITVVRLDLSDLTSVHSFSTKMKQSQTRLDVLLNNAGIMMVPYGQTVDGFEKQIGTNHLGHFALTGLLLELLKKTPGSRVVNVSSMAHKSGVMDFNNLLYDNGKDYSPMKAYGRSKLCNLLFTYELQRYFEANKIDCKALAAHPGFSDTNLFVHMATKWIIGLFKPLLSLIIQPASMGTLPELRASVDPNAKGGEFYGPDGRQELKGYPVVVQPKRTALDKESARKLREISEKLTDIKYT
ncbi:MAG: oxidoreductase [Paludibacter sp.]|nr:oxidoreductase [Paludibacter sp.]